MRSRTDKSLFTIPGFALLRDFVTSGFTEERQAAMEAWPDALRLFAHLRSLGAPLRLPDLDAWVRALGCAPLPVPCGAFQATPMRHGGAAVGGFFLGGREGGFTDADEAMLELFAQQAGAALANARAHRDEQRARADLEALVEISAPGGASVRALIDATPIRAAEDGAVERVVVTLQDLAPFEALTLERAEFLGLVSHELRAPLAAIRGAALTALEDPRDPGRSELRQYLRIVEEQAGRMSGLIGDLLDAGLIGAGMLSVDPAPEEVTGLVERARTAFAAGGGSHAVAVDVPEDLPRVTADPRRIAQVLENLFANAAHHSPESAPIRVEARRDGEEIEVSVIDAGAGIAPERLSHLFRRHAGIGAAEAVGERAQGTGLGLVICRGLVEAHGGRIRAESAGPGRGTRIVFTLPVAEDATASVSAPPARDAAEKTPVLVVDDDPHALRHARDALAAAGYAPVATAEPGEIPRLVETKRPALVVLDLVLPGVDGIELMRTLPALADLPVIFVSAYGGGDTIARALEAGAADYIVKPYSPAELTATEYRLLHALSLDAGGATTFEALQRRVWGPGRGDPQAVRSAVTKLRRKLGDDARNPRYILGERGLGYRMPEPDRP